MADVKRRVVVGLGLESAVVIVGQQVEEVQVSRNTIKRIKVFVEYLEGKKKNYRKPITSKTLQERIKQTFK